VGIILILQRLTVLGGFLRNGFLHRVIRGARLVLNGGGGKFLMVVNQVLPLLTLIVTRVD